MPTGLRGGTETYWRSWGDGPPQALLIHCTLAHSGAWSAFADRLNRPAVAFDLPEHGRSGAADPARDLHDQSTAMAASFLGDDPIDVIGHSFGGTIALRLAVEEPERIRRLVLVEPVFFAALRGTPLMSDHAAIFAPFDAAISRGEFLEAARLFTARWGTGADWDRLGEKRQRRLAEQIQLIPRQAPGIHEDCAGVLSAGRLERCTLPVLLIQGALCEATVDGINTHLSKRLPNAKRAVIANAGHMAPISHADEVAALVNRFLRE